LGKTAATLETIRIFKKYRLTRKRTLVIAPLSVAVNTWPDEIARWDRFNHLKFAVLHGKDKRDYHQDKDIDVINPEGLTWLFNEMSDHYRTFTYDNLIIDESTLFKNKSSLRSKIIDFYLHRFPRRSLLTGTPIPNSLLDIYGQIYLIDRGAALGKSETRFKREYFFQVGHTDHDQWAPFPESSRRIERKIAPLVCRVDAHDYKSIPPLKINVVPVVLPKPAQRIYDNMEEDFFATIDDEEVFAKTESSKYNALRQIAAGGLYKPLDWYDVPTSKRPIFSIHQAKLDRLCALKNELRGKPILVGYHFRFVPKHVLESKMIEAPAFINGQTNKKADRANVQAWNLDEIPTLFGHPASMGHGLNLHYGSGRHIVWFNIPDNHEQYDQFNRRIYGRNGVREPVTLHLLVAKNTIEEVILNRLRSKNLNQQSLLEGLKKYRRERR
jgi:SNF2 family DNA or RNA helicase